MAGVFGKRDARPERQSSWLSGPGGARAGLATLGGPLRLGFAAFLLWHFSLQAYRAHTDQALPEAGFERAPWFVGALVLVVWLPFMVFGALQLRRSFTRGSLPTDDRQARALAAVEPLALAIVLVFGAVHGVLMAWPILSGALTEIDVRPELIADLSSTWRGVPLPGAAYLCAVGAASFYAARSALAALPGARPWLSRSVVGLALLSYLLGSYAVIRCGSGSLLP